MRISPVVLLLGLPLAACTSFYGVGSGVTGSGVLMEEVRDVAAFTAVEITGAFTAEITVGADQLVTASGDDNIVPLMETEVSGDRLTVGLKSGTTSVNPKSGMKVTINIPELTYLGASGASQVTITGIESKSFEIVASGASNVTADGEATDLTLEASGASRVEATRLLAQTAAAVASGASRIEVSAADALDAEASGASGVCYSGSPAVTENASGASKVEACD